ncbi:MAG: AI-2E family transporter [Gammaproteobacteria bacterium]
MPTQLQPDAALPLIRFGLALMVIAGLYLGQDVLIPIALAVLLSFVLAPAADRLERWRLPPVPSVIATVILAFSILGGVGLIVSNQVVSLAESLPKYRDNITQRFLSLQGGEGGVFDRAAETFFAIQEDIKKETCRGRARRRGTTGDARTSRQRAVNGSAAGANPGRGARRAAVDLRTPQGLRFASVDPAGAAGAGRGAGHFLPAAARGFA